jgi:hypothetical protein
MSNNKNYREVLSQYLNDINNSSYESDNESTSNDSTEFNKEQYTKFYELVNNVILFFIMNTYETQIKNIKSDNFDIDTINNLMNDIENLQNTLKLQLNIYWIEVNNNNKDQLVIDMDNILKLDIIKHYYCLFTFIKNMALNIIKETAKIKLDINNTNEFIEKITKISHAILQINTITGLDDMDEFDCNNCMNIKNIDIFWN